MSVAKSEPGLSKLMAFVPVLGLAVLVGLFTWGLLRTKPAASDVVLGQPVPTLALETLKGQTLALSDLPQRAGDDGRAVPVIVNYWATWCAPCEAEHPLLVQAASEGVTLFGVLYKEDGETAKGWLEERGDPFVDVLLDTRGRLGLEQGLRGVPETFVIGSDGVILARHIGPLTPESLAGLIETAQKAKT
jgi:cytochrome c biogenesis protein CcmG/thiol:disulfide interchange protein DsbE